MSWIRQPVGLPLWLSDKESNPPDNAGDTGSMPGQGRSHLPLSTEQLSLCATATEPVLWSPTTKPTCPKARALQQERPPQWETLTAQLESRRRSQLEKSPHNNNDLAQPKTPTKIYKTPFLFFRSYDRRVSEPQRKTHIFQHGAN